MSYSKTDQLKQKGKLKKKRNPRKTLENKLDKLAAEICRAQGHCTICSKQNGVLNAHHFKSRRYRGVRWYLPNLICLCVHHHTFNHTFSAHKTPEAFKEKMIELRGKEWFEDIERRATEHTSWKTVDLETLLQELKTKSDLLKA